MPGTYDFGVFHLDATERQLLRDGRPVALPPKAFDLLLDLVEHAGHLREKKELMDALWPGTFVEEVNLAYTVSALRKALGDTREHAEFIETVPTKGYRFVGPMKRPEPTTASGSGLPVPGLPASHAPTEAPRRAPFRAWVWVALAGCLGAGIALYRFVATVPPHGVKSIVVLPLEDRSGSPEYFADGLTDGLIVGLSRLAQFEKVINRRSAMTYKRSSKSNAQIARELGVEALLIGSVFRSGDLVRITAQVVDPNGDRVLWAGSFERPIRDVLVLQRELVHDVVTGVTLELLPTARLPTAPVDPAAYDLYLQGLAAFNSYAPDSLARAPLLFRQAVARDPRFARPRAALAIAMVHDRNINGTFDEGEARRAVDEALSLDPADGEAQSADGVLLELDWKWREAEEAHRRAVVLSPNNTLVRMGRSHHFGMLARYDEAIAEARRAVSLDPASDAAKGELFWASMHARRFDECVRLGRELGASWFVEYCEARLGRVSSVCAAGRDRPVCGYAHAVAGDAGEAARILRGSCASLARDLASTSHDVFEHYGTLCLQLSAAMGAPESMLEWTERLVQKHNFFCAYFHGPDTYDLLKDQPRFQAVLRQIGLPR